MFTLMQVTWQACPDNIGHLNFPGCFRCHDGKHRAAGGAVISNRCNDCHHIVSQGRGKEQETSVSGLEFRHPGEVGDAWREMLCSDCHTGGAM